MSKQPSDYVKWVTTDPKVIVDTVRKKYAKYMTTPDARLSELAVTPPLDEVVLWLCDCWDELHNTQSTLLRMNWIQRTGLIKFDMVKYQAEQRRPNPDVTINDLLDELQLRLIVADRGIDDDLTDILRI